MKTEKRNIRMTLYLSAGQVDHAERIQRAIREENSFFPELSQNAWWNIVISSGLDALQDETTTRQEA